MASTHTRKPPLHQTPQLVFHRSTQLPTRFTCGTLKKKSLRKRSTRELHSDLCQTVLPSHSTTERQTLAPIISLLSRTLFGSLARALGCNGGLTGRTDGTYLAICASDGCSTDSLRTTKTMKMINERIRVMEHSTYRKIKQMGKASLMYVWKVPKNNICCHMLCSSILYLNNQ